MVTWEASEIRIEGVPENAHLNEDRISLGICQTMSLGVRAAERRAHERQNLPSEGLADQPLVDDRRRFSPGLDDFSNASSTELLQRLLDVPGVTAVAVVARNGFVAESIGITGDTDIHQLGASLGMLLHGVEDLVAGMEPVTAKELIMESADVMILCRPVGGALLTLFASDPKQLGRVRLRVQRCLPRLAELF